MACRSRTGRSRRRRPPSSACPFTSGFFSKDEILYRAFVDRTVNPQRRRRAAAQAGTSTRRRSGSARSSTWSRVAAATLTAFYMCRALLPDVLGRLPGWTVGRPSLLAQQELAPHDGARRRRRARPRTTRTSRRPGYPPHESPWQMTVPLIILAAFSLFAGHPQPGLRHPEGPADGPLARAGVQGGDRGAVVFAHDNDAAWAEHMEWPLALGGIARVRRRHGARLVDVHRARRASPRSAPRRGAARASTSSLLDKWRVDELYDATVDRGGRLARRDARGGRQDDRRRHPRALHVARRRARPGRILRAFQNGVVHVYAAMMVVGLAVIGWFFAVPHPNATVVDAGNDDYVVTAAPGRRLRVPLGRRRRRQAREAGLRRRHDREGARRAGQDADGEPRGAERVRARAGRRPSSGAAASADVVALRHTMAIADTSHPLRAPHRGRRARCLRRRRSSPGSSSLVAVGVARRLLLRRRRPGDRRRRPSRRSCRGSTAGPCAARSPRWRRCSRSSSCACGPGAAAADATRRRPPRRGHLLSGSSGCPLVGRDRHPLHPRQAHAAFAVDDAARDARDARALAPAARVPMGRGYHFNEDVRVDAALRHPLPRRGRRHLALAGHAHGVHHADRDVRVVRLDPDAHQGLVLRAAPARRRRCSARSSRSTSSSSTSSGS